MGTTHSVRPATTDSDFENYYVSSKGKYIYTRTYLPKDVPIKAMVILAHGLFGHSGRNAYTILADHLNPKGYAIFALDHQGHGKSEGIRASIDNFEHYCDDLEEFVHKIIEKHGKTLGKPFILGHSLGGCIVLRTVLRNQTLYQGMILNGPAIWLHNDENYTAAIKLAAQVAAKVMPQQKVDDEDIYKLSRNRDACEAYAQDPLVCTKVGCRAIIAAELIRVGHSLHKQWHGVDLPFVVFHGDADVTCSPVGSQTFHKDAMSTDKTLVMLPGFFHEPWEDPECETFYSTLIDWLEARCPNKED